MAEVVIYTSPLCGYCHAAKRLLADKNVDFNEISVAFDAKLRAEMREKAGGRTSVPQIFIDGHHVGGCDDLYALEEAGKLDPLLQGAPA